VDGVGIKAGSRRGAGGDLDGLMERKVGYQD
jgi:hypothetical protein